MTGGLTVIAVIGFLLTLGLAMLPDMREQAPMFVASLIAGGAGAVLSVLYGMTSGNLGCTRCSPTPSPPSGRSSPPARCARCSARSRGRSSTCC